MVNAGKRRVAFASPAVTGSSSKKAKKEATPKRTSVRKSLAHEQTENEIISITESPKAQGKVKPSTKSIVVKAEPVADSLPSPRKGARREQENKDSSFKAREVKNSPSLVTKGNQKETKATSKRKAEDEDEIKASPPIRPRTMTLTNVKSPSPERKKSVFPLKTMTGA